MTETAEQQHQDTHQQGHSDDSDGLPCLHCRLLKTYDTWVSDYEAIAGEKPEIMMMAERLGAFIGEMSSMVCDAVDGDAAIMVEFAATVVEGQTLTAPEPSEVKDAEPVTAPNPDTKH